MLYGTKKDKYIKRMGKKEKKTYNQQQKYGLSNTIFIKHLKYLNNFLRSGPKVFYFILS